MIKPSFLIKKVKEKDNYGKFIFEPLEQGFGQTLGNSLRRVLLSNIPGAAVEKVKIGGVKHQFSTLEGVKQDIVDFILNIKRIRFAYSGNKEIKISLSAKGPKEIAARDIKTPAELKIVNKKMKLLSLADKKSSVDVTMWINSGYGYSPAEERKSSSLGVIPIDALYSPVIRVNYKVESTRVGRRTDYDRLIMELYTDGAIKPKKAIEKAAQILELYFRQVYKPVIVEKEEEAVDIKKDNEVFKLTVEELSLPTRIANALRRGGYPNVESLTMINKEQLNKVKNLGTKSIEIIEEKLKDKGVGFKHET